MADNLNLPPASAAAAADEVTYSGDPSYVQLVRVVDVAGAEGSKTVNTDPTRKVHVTGSDLTATARTTDSIAAASVTDAVMNGLTVLTPKFAAISAASAGDNQLVALVSGKKIRVLAGFVKGAAAVNVKFRSNTTDKTGLMAIAAAGDGMVLPFNPLGWFETTAGEALNLNLSAAVSVGGGLTYIEV